MLPHVQLSTSFGLDYLLIAKKYVPLHQQPILQLVDDCTSNIVKFPLYRDFPDLIQYDWLGILKMTDHFATNIKGP